MFSNYSQHGRKLSYSTNPPIPERKVIIPITSSCLILVLVLTLAGHSYTSTALPDQTEYPKLGNAIGFSSPIPYGLDVDKWRGQYIGGLRHSWIGLLHYGDAGNITSIRGVTSGLGVFRKIYLRGVKLHQLNAFISVGTSQFLVISPYLEVGYSFVGELTEVDNLWTFDLGVVLQNYGLNLSLENLVLFLDLQVSTWL